MTTMTDTGPAIDIDTATEVVLGVDTHRDEHVVALLNPLGALIATSSFPTTAAGYDTLLEWAQSFGDLHRAGIECTGSYGAGLSRRLQAAGVQVIEVNQTDRHDRRKRGKTDTLDAQAAARAVLSGRAQAVAKTADGRVEAPSVRLTFEVHHVFKGEARSRTEVWTHAPFCSLDFRGQGEVPIVANLRHGRAVFGFCSYPGSIDDVEAAFGPGTRPIGFESSRRIRAGATGAILIYVALTIRRQRTTAL